MAIWYGKRYKKPVVAYAHSLEWELVAKSIGLKGFKESFMNKIVRVISSFLYNRCSLIIAPSLEVAEVLSWKKIKTNKTIVNMGVDVNTFAPSKNQFQQKRNIGVSPSKKVIGFVGRLGREKDLRTLHRAITMLKKKYNIALLIVGEGIEELEDLFKKKEDVVFVGSTDNVINYLQAMDIYVLPSLTETSSLSTMEAMSCEVAVIATPVGCIKDYIKDGVNGLFFTRKDSYDLSKKIEMLLTDNRLRNKISINARKTIVEKFSFEKTVNGIKKVLEVY